ncbi:hypothetical protein FF1_032784 [Malus domestica]
METPTRKTNEYTTTQNASGKDIRKPKNHVVSLSSFRFPHSLTQPPTKSQLSLSGSNPQTLNFLGSQTPILPSTHFPSHLPPFSPRNHLLPQTLKVQTSHLLMLSFSLDLWF